MNDLSFVLIAKPAWDCGHRGARDRHGQVFDAEFFREARGHTVIRIYGLAFNFVLLARYRHVPTLRTQPLGIMVWFSIACRSLPDDMFLFVNPGSGGNKGQASARGLMLSI